MTVLCLVVSDPLRPRGLYLPGSLVHGDPPGKKTGVGCPALFQGIFPTQGSNPGLPHCRQTLPSEPPGKPTEKANLILFTYCAMKSEIKSFIYSFSPLILF